jgi:hypothetical protein
VRDAGKQSTYAPARSAGVVGTARWKGGSGNRGRPVGARVAASTSLRAAASAGVGQGSMTVEAG